jgi:hypothetical protein
VLLRSAIALRTFARPHRHAKLLKVTLGQLGEDIQVDFVLAEDCLVPCETEAPQPTPDIHVGVLMCRWRTMIVQAKQPV